jgi:hypothetical protein
VNYNSLTPTLRLLGFLGNPARRAVFSLEMFVRFPRPLTWPSGSTTEAALHTGRQVEFSLKHCFMDIFGNFKQDFFHDPATRFLVNLLVVSRTMWVHII